MPEESGISDRSSMWDIVSLDEAVETDDPSKREGGTHLKYGKVKGLSLSDADFTKTLSLVPLPSFAGSSSPNSLRRYVPLVNARTVLSNLSLGVYSLTRQAANPAPLFSRPKVRVADSRPWLTSFQMIDSSRRRSRGSRWTL